jgi:hypothetical protein
VETYQCLKNNPKEDNNSNSNRLQDGTRRYLVELKSPKVDYVDQEGGRKLVGMQNIPLVYGHSMLGSTNWDRCRPELLDGWYAEQRKACGVGDWPTTVVEDARMGNCE